MYAKLGDIEFAGLFSFDTLTFENGAKISEIERIGGKPVLQRTGGQLEKINATINIHREFQDPQIVIDGLRNYVDTSEVLPYLDGAGRLYGNFVLTRLTEGVNILGTSGEKIGVELTLELLEHHDPNPAITEAINFVNTAYALDDNKPVQVARLSDQKTVLVTSLTLTSIGQNNVNDSLDTIATIQDTPAQQASKMETIKKNMEVAVDSFQKAVTAANDKRDRIEAVSANYIFDLEAIGTAANSMRVAAENGDLSGVVNFASTLAGRSLELATSRRPLDFLAISKRNI